MHFIRHLPLIGFLACGFLAGPAYAAIPDSELAVLRDFYASTGGDNWLATVIGFRKWFADDTDPCAWVGVGCDVAHEHIIGLNLGGENLTGRLPGNLAELTHLRYLVVDNNQLTGPIPSLAGLTDLEAVFAAHNQLTGPIPPLDGLTSLGYVALDHNQLTGPVPRSVSDLPGLQYFIVENNRLSGRVPRAPATLTRFGAALCPNQIDTRPSTGPAVDASWNTATGLTPWWRGPGGACAAPAADATALRAFTTSTTGTGNLHTWSEVAATDLTGLEAADGICQARARAADLLNPGDYVAWLSDRNDDAYCRVLGLSGRKADNCGQAALPTNAGPWLRTDGVPFAGTIDAALDANVVFAPLNVDEFGSPFTTTEESFAATDIDGTFNKTFNGIGDCERWSAASSELPAVALGSNLSTGGSWTFDGHGVGCSARQRLTCMQKGAAPALSGHGQPGRRVAFATSVDVSGDLGGIAGADATCRNLAASANLNQPDSFKALLASPEFAKVTDRFTFDGPWYRRDGLLFAHDKAELTGGAVTLPLNVTETGGYLGISVAFTGTTRAGTLQQGLNCHDWTLADSSRGEAALANSIALVGSNGNWLSNAEVSCAATIAPDDWPRKLFCLSDSDAVFNAGMDEIPATP